LEQIDEAVRLTVMDGIDIPGSMFIEAVSAGWPLVLSNLKSLLETGEVVMKENTYSYGRSNRSPNPATNLVSRSERA
jgi:hypothetical protein